VLSSHNRASFSHPGRWKVLQALSGRTILAFGRSSIPRHHGKRTKPNLTQGLQLHCYLEPNEERARYETRRLHRLSSPSSAFSLRPKMNPIPSVSDVRRASAALPTLGECDSLVMRDKRDRGTLPSPSSHCISNRHFRRRMLPPSHPGCRPDFHCIRECSQETTVSRDPRSRHKKQTTEIKPDHHFFERWCKLSPLSIGRKRKTPRTTPSCKGGERSRFRTDYSGLVFRCEGAQNVAFPIPIPIPVSNFDNAQRGGKKTRRRPVPM
jgi:hypothetical protein